MTELKTLKDTKALWAEGLSNREIARRQGLAHGTIRYRLNKLGLQSHFKLGKRPKNFKSDWFKGHTKTSYGYVIIKARNHPNADKQGYVREHHLVMEKHLGRYLKEKEVVHHHNEIKNDNRIENLFLFPNDSLHRKYHMTKKYQKPDLTEEGFMQSITEDELK